MLDTDEKRTRKVEETAEDVTEIRRHRREGMRSTRQGQRLEESVGPAHSEPREETDAEKGDVGKRRGLGVVQNRPTAPIHRFKSSTHPKQDKQKEVHSWSPYVNLQSTKGREKTLKAARERERPLSQVRS